MILDHLVGEPLGLVVVGLGKGKFAGFDLEHVALCGERHEVLGLGAMP